MIRRMPLIAPLTLLLVPLAAGVSRGQPPSPPPADIVITIHSPDVELAEAVQLTLRHDAYAFPYLIRVAATDGTVILQGKVDSELAQRRVEQVAASVAGVKQVRNQVTIDPSIFVKPDWKIKEDIEAELVWSPLVPANAVAVQVADGVATLRGEVRDLEAKHAALANAIQGGARRVENLLTLKPHVNRALGSPWRSLRY